MISNEATAKTFNQDAAIIIRCSVLGTKTGLDVPNEAQGITGNTTDAWITY